MDDVTAFLLFIFLVPVGIVLIALINGLNRQNNCKNVIKRHVATLAVKREQKLIRDDYGNINTKKWEKEKKYFVTEVLQVPEKVYIYINIYQSIDKIINKWIKEQESRGISTNYVIGPEHFENKTKRKIRVKSVN